MLPPSGGKPIDAFSAPSRRTAIIWGIRYYGFVGGVVLIGLTVVLLTILVLMKPPETEPELTAEDVARLQSTSPAGPRAPSFTLEPATVTINVNPADADVRLNGDAPAEGVWREAQMRPGYYLLSVSRDGYLARDSLIELSEGANATIAISLMRDTPAARAQREAAEMLPVRPAEPPPQQQPRESVAAAPTPSAAAPEPEYEEVVETPPAPPATGRLAVVTEPVDARIMVNGEPVGTAPAFISDLPVGEHEVMVHAPGYAASAHFVNVQAGQQRTLRVNLEALQGTLSVLVRPWGSIFLNGTLVERDTDVLYSTNLTSGSHTIEVVHPTLGRRTRSVEVRPGLTTRVVFELDTN